MKNENSIPKSIKQIGNPSMLFPEVYIEDYALCYIKKISQKSFRGCAAGVLLGCRLSGEEGTKVIIRGAIYACDVEENCNSQDTRWFREYFDDGAWSRVYEKKKEMFYNLDIVGWFIGGPGFMLDDEEKLHEIHKNHFNGAEKIFLRADSLEGEECFMKYQEDRLTTLPGYYVFFERNEAMQKYMLSERDRCVYDEEKYVQETAAYKPEQIPVNEIKNTLRQEVEPETENFSGEKKGNEFATILMYACVVLIACVVLFAIIEIVGRTQENRRLMEVLGRDIGNIEMQLDSE